MSHFAVLSVTPPHDMIRDLLQRLDLHGDVKPVNDMRCRLRQRFRQPFHDLGAIGKNRYLATARIALALQGLQRSGLKLALRCVSGREIADWARAASARPHRATTISKFLPASAWLARTCAVSMFTTNSRSGSFGRFNSIWRRSAIEGGSNQVRSRALSSRRSPSFNVRWRRVTKELGRFDRQELGHHLRRFAIRQEATQTRGTLHQLRRRLIRADIAQDCPGVTKAASADP